MLSSLALIVLILEIILIVVMKPSFYKILIGRPNYVKNGRVSGFSSASSPDSVLIKSQALNVLTQHKSVLNLVSEADYVKKCPDIFNASVGGHIRHAVNHFQRVVYVEEDQSDPILNYDERKRDTLIETNKNEALAEIDIMMKMIPHLNLQKSVKASFMGDEKTFETYTIPSTLGRELSFVSHHGVHHLATVKLIMHTMKYSFDKDSTIGIAVSTVQDNEKKKIKGDFGGSGGSVGEKMGKNAFHTVLVE